MKNIVAKIISILALMLMLINSSLMLVISTAIDAVQSIIDESKINAIYELNLEKYVNYKVGDTPGLMVQANLKTGIEYQDGQEYVPIEATNVILNTPKVNEEYPERVEIVAKSTKATNGDENGKDFNYAYNKDNGEIKLITENKADENGNIEINYQKSWHFHLCHVYCLYMRVPHFRISEFELHRNVQKIPTTVLPAD